MTRRAYLLSVLSCLAGAGLTAYGITRVWSVQVTHRTGMSDLRTERTGADLAPWVIGLALVALAGAGALLATTGWRRRALGGLLVLCGGGVAAGATVARAGLGVGVTGVGVAVWPLACAAGGALISVGGLVAARHGHRWPGMSARYERSTVPPPRAGSSPVAEAAPAARRQELDHRAAWEALDRGDDPTAL
jgi:uncharacterized membrane protein (TIGR02234 family)